MTPETSPERHIVLAGAGIGGLTAALALSGAGFRVTLIERNAALSELGAGIQLSPNAHRILDSLGVIERLGRDCVQPLEIRLNSVRAGGLVGRVPLGDTAVKRYGAPYCVVHRGDLHRALLAAVTARGDIDIHLGAAVADAESDDDGVTVEVQGEDGASTLRGDALIGADGVWSAVRRRMLRLPSAQFSGRIAYRALIPATHVRAEDRVSSSVWMGPRAHLVHYPIRGGEALNLVAVVEDDWHEEEWSAPGDPEQLLPRFADWPEAPRSLLQRPDTWLKWALCDVGPGTIWTEGRISLLGDAAHAMLPFMAQGGAMAIEDAAVLARSLTENADTPAALLAYERDRKDRVERVMRTARDNARTYHQDGVGAMIRDMGIRFLSGEKLLHRYDWLYGWRM
ncbi:FAD-dependent monooxygenase [Breoghania sp. L-A4]|uniref:FAD-dependent monooxygenase n=1 Tax=Breoghania sp. L-A4 TaxID=2304600 RepID=UPI000E35E40B|nr:FAD-dependent monooxygenase [Breoghania sp. L-A4]AXS41111.1 monooxygenase [Breoghania sp. L-A4]